jgi:pyridoxamine 5'-phosphate oxidase
MENTIAECIRFANENKICFLATDENSQPRVRALGFWFADETGFYFQTGMIKDLFRQLIKNPKAEACFYKPGPDAGITMRISGETEFVNDKSLKEKVLNERPFLKEFGLTVDSPGLIIFRIAHGNAFFWTMENNLKKKKLIPF